MVNLGNENPNHPEQGQNFTVEALNGEPPYTFTYSIGDGNPTTVLQDEATLTIPVPSGTAGQMLLISVEDNNSEIDNMSKRITASGGGLAADVETEA